MLAMAQNFSISRISNWFTPQPSNTVTFDRSYVILAVMMYMIGLVMVASSSMPVAERLFNNPFHFVTRHFIYILLSVCIAAVTLQIPMSWWHKNSGSLLLLGMVLLVIVLLIGAAAATRPCPTWRWSTKTWMVTSTTSAIPMPTAPARSPWPPPDRKPCWATRPWPFTRKTDAMRI